MIRIEIFISGGSDIDRYRDIAGDALRRLDQMFFHELHVGAAIGNWDFRMDAPRVVAPDEFAARSLQMVDLAHACVGIFAEECPDVTKQEIWHCFELRRAGAKVEVFIFLHPDVRTPDHDGFFEAIASEFGEAIVWAPYRNDLDFQAAVLTTLTPYLLRHLGIVTSAPTGVAS